MANNWGQGSNNNIIGWGQGAANNSIGWGASHYVSSAADTDIIGLAGVVNKDFQARVIADGGTFEGIECSANSLISINNIETIIPPLDAATTAFLSATAITDATITSAIDTLVLGMKADGTWSKMKAIYPFVGANATSHSYNLKNTAVHQITWFGGLTHDANGVTPNGTNGYGNLNFNPRTHLGTQSSYGTYCRVNNASNSKVDFGSSNLDGWNHYMYLQNFGTCEYTQFRTFGNNILIANTTTNAFFHAGLDTNNDLFLYKNNTLLQSKTPAVIGTPPNINTTLFAHNANLTIQQFSPRPSSFFFAASGTTQADNASIYSRIQAFQTTLGRQV